MPTWHELHEYGKVVVERQYGDMGITGPMTVVFRGALSVTTENDAAEAFLCVRAYDPASDKAIYFAFSHFMPRTYSGGVPICDAKPPSADCGKFGVRNYQNDPYKNEKPLIDGLGPVEPNTFFTFRAICDPANGGTATIYVNEDTPNPSMAVVDNSTFGSEFDWGYKTGPGGDHQEIRFGVRNDKCDLTVWVDYVKVYEVGRR